MPKEIPGLYDRRCAELAEVFLAPYSESIGADWDASVAVLASRIQDTIEDYIADRTERERPT